MADETTDDKKHTPQPAQSPDQRKASMDAKQRDDVETDARALLRERGILK